MEEFVSGGGCDDGSGSYRNPLSKMVNHLYRDTSQKEQEEWKHYDPHQLNSNHEPTLTTHTPTLSSKEEIRTDFSVLSQNRALDPLNAFGNLSLNDFENFERNLPIGMEAPSNGLSKEVPPDLLKDYVKSFIDSSLSRQTFRPMNIPEFSALSPLEKMKIGKRSEVLARHLAASSDQRFVDSQLTLFLESLNIENEHFQEPEVSFSTDEFLEREKQFHEGHFRDFDRFYDEASHTTEMVQEFEQFDRQREFDHFFNEVEETQRWVDEFEGRRSIERIPDQQSIRDLTGSISQIQDPKLQKTKFMQLMERISKGQVEFTEDGIREKEDDFSVEDFTAFENRQVDWANDFLSRENQDWATDFLNPTSDWSSEYLGAEEGNWEDEFTSGLWNPSISKQVQDYQFTDPSQNPYVGVPDALKKGKQLFQDGRLSQAILAFEAELQQNPENSECWIWLGQAHAENDKDLEAISALKKAVETNPQNLQAHMTLAVSYTNESEFRFQALESLREWMKNHPIYSEMASKELSSNFQESHNLVTDMFIDAARMRPDDPDPDVQTCLGLLYNLSQDYEKAIDCFKAALSARPDDYLLWNRLGATQANSGHSEEALGCYFNALKIKPSYVRARSNLGISYMALRAYEKAARCFLGALSMHPNAEQLWEHLAVVFFSMGREDLAEKVWERNIDTFRTEFEF